MITGVYSNYQLNAKQFDSLFTDAGNIDISTLYLLGKSAADGNLNCIDMLHNLALRHDDVGRVSENIIFDLFNGKEKGRVGIDEEIQKASLKLYEIACNAKNENNKDMKKFNSPSKLLYIAGSAIKDLTQKQDVSAILCARDTAQSPHEQFDNVDLWSNHRMLMTDEINSAITDLVSEDNLSLNFPIGLIECNNKSNFLSEQIAGKITDADIFDKTEVFPVNTGEHWVLFVLYKDAGNDVKCVVFNSLFGLDESTKNSLIDSAKIAGVNENNIKFINGGMQENVPGGCGIFVIKATELLSNNVQRNPVDILNNFVEDFSKLSAEEQLLFNIQSRRQLYAHTLARGT